MKTNNLVLSILVVLSLFLSACSSGGSSDSGSSGIGTSSIAYLIDSPVANLHYETQSKSGETGYDGGFEYLPTDNNVTFSIGKITLATIAIGDINADSKVYLQDLVGVPRDNITNAELLKLATLLQSLDTGANPDAITLDSADLALFDEEMSIDDIAAVLAKAGKTPLRENVVKAHLNVTIAKHNAAATAEAAAANPDDNTLATAAGDALDAAEAATTYLNQIIANTAPIATDLNTSVAHNSANNEIILGASDDALTYSIVEYSGINGAVTIIDNKAVYTPFTNFVGADSFTFKVNDGIEDSNIARVIIRVGIIHNEVGYATVTSPYTGKVWLDRNLGASQACTALDDTLCYGDYYQWGRNTDGHQVSSSATNAAQATDINSVGHSDFITATNDNDYDWAQAADSDGSLRATNWSKTDGSSICPVGFRVPTEKELRDETLDNTAGDNFANNTDAYSNFLKLPSAGYRKGGDGSLGGQGAYGIVWSSSVTGSNSHLLNFNSGYAITYDGTRTYGLSVRCIRNTPVAIDQNTSVEHSSGSNEITLTASDVDTSDVFTYSIVDDPAHGTVTITGDNKADYIPSDGFIGEDSFTFKVNDGTVDSNIARVTISVGIVHNGVTYSAVTSPYTSKVWLDRNLGASQACTALDDTACYGDYYQWGRNTDGHQVSSSATNTAQATDINSVGHSDFITATDTNDYDWAKAADSDGSLRAANWSKTDGISVCPVGFRVPTIQELKDETTEASTPVTNNIDAYNNFLKLPSVGYRRTGGSMEAVGSGGLFWSSNVLYNDSLALGFSSASVHTSHHDRVLGFSVRCLRD